MHKLGWIALTALLIGASSAEAADLAFHQPASLTASKLESRTLQWALLVFDSQTEAAFSLESEAGIQLSNDTMHYALVTRSVESRQVVDGQGSHNERFLPGPLGIEANFAPGQPGSVLIVAEQIDLELSDVLGTLRSKPAGGTLEDFSRPIDVEKDRYRKSGAPGTDDVVLSVTPESTKSSANFRLATQGAAKVEWYNADVRCSQGSDCPDGGGPAILRVADAFGYATSSEYHSYETLHGISDLAAQGTLDYAVLGSANLTVSLLGSVRLPLTNMTGMSCDSCVSRDEQTLAATGNINLTHLRMAPDGRISGGIDGDIQSARLDEAAIDPQLLFSGARNFGIAAAVTGGAAAIYLLWWMLFTWNRGEDLLSNARRRRIYDVVVQNPGIHVRAALRAANVPAGSGRHHVNRMVETGLLMSQRNQSVMVLFENHGKYRNSWREAAALRDPNARLLMTWLTDNPSSTQKAILDAFLDRSGWNRSTTQKRLNRLQREGMVGVRMYGRYKLYSVVRPIGTSAEISDASRIVVGA